MLSIAMNSKSIAKKYAQALFDVTKKDNSTSKAFTELQQVMDKISANNFIKAVIMSDSIPSREKQECVDPVLKELKPITAVQNCVTLLVKNNRTSALKEVIGYFGQLIHNDNNELVMNVETADSLTAKTKASLIKTLEEQLSKKIILRESVNKDLIGGMVLKYGSYKYDASIKTLIAKMKLKALSSL
jgi:F-type H+-transporting ATPase subunit delta